MSAGRLVGVGVGPGDPEHLTLKALRELRAADRVFVPGTDSTAGGPGRAEAVVAPHVPPARVERLGFAMRDEARREDRWAHAGAAIAEVVRDGGTAAFATIGDPNLYSTFVYVARSVRALVPGVEVETVPGITALQDLAARSGTVLAEGDERLALVPWPAGEDRLREALDGFDCVVVYKGGRDLPRLLDAIRGAGRLDHSIYGEHLGLRGGDVRAADQRDGRGPYLSTVIVPPPGGTVAGARLTRDGGSRA
jgi:precorrin-2/cobalt-factor-2 C20-methyltransferase